MLVVTEVSDDEFSVDIVLHPVPVYHVHPPNELAVRADNDGELGRVADMVGEVCGLLGLGERRDEREGFLFPLSNRNGQGARIVKLPKLRPNPAIRPAALAGYAKQSH